MSSFFRCRHLALAAFVLVPAVANAAPPATRKASPPTPSANANANGNRHGSTARVASASSHVAMGKSIGSPTEGHLVGGARLTEGTHLRFYPVYNEGDVRWGLESLVNLIDRSARAVKKQFPDAVLSVGHLSKPGGGEVDRHASHESGRDADIGFYVKNVAGKAVYAEHMVAFKGDGTAPSWPGAHFDDAKNWALVAAMLSDANCHITHIFVATPIRERLLSYAQKSGAPASLRVRASEVLAQPRGALPHDDHFHVRIGCPPGMDKCIEQPIAKSKGRAHSSVANARTHASPSNRAPVSRAPAKAPAKPAPAPAPAPERSERGEESAKSDSIIPSLAPDIPGLGSAVIPAPLGGMRSPWGGTKEPVAPASPPIDDPDGVLEGR
ncbi:hypothetical protein AKJ09_09939 [Labilithrix luteola]|uniref:Murein endopeptidase n=1 Tax=Labilithrix luteola TaxID=1391654 RepID=A0A0K1QBX3_9BACT|nr:penicillin-insensitive murein endopeptidase [Labilithrix luteola]AKV03276.1 hypothetical protein AKJ09_09939 [Labilithrix luteola]